MAGLPSRTALDFGPVEAAEDLAGKAAVIIGRPLDAEAAQLAESPSISSGPSRGSQSMDYVRSIPRAS